MSKSESTGQSSKIQVRMVWRLVLCLFGHLTLLFFLAIYLVSSLNSVRLYTPVAHAEEMELESLNIIPALLGAMDAQRRVFEKSGDPRDLTLYAEMRDSVEGNLRALNTPLVLPSDAEKERRILIQQWISNIGDVATAHVTIPKRAPITSKPSGATSFSNVTPLNDASDTLLGQIHTVTEQVRTEMKGQLASLQAEEAGEANGRVTLMWLLVGSVTFFTILIQLALANSIIGPIQALAGVVRRVQRGDYSARAQLRSGDEIQSLGETFNAMAENIVRTQKELREKNERLSLAAGGAAQRERRARGAGCC